MLPLGCFPLWGREGVTLVAAVENYRMTRQSGFQLNKKDYNYLNLGRCKDRHKLIGFTPEP